MSDMDITLHSKPLAGKRDAGVSAAETREGYEPPLAHRFDRVWGNRFCGRCGAGEYHEIHKGFAEYFTPDRRPTDPQGLRVVAPEEKTGAQIIQEIQEIQGLLNLWIARDLVRKTDREQQS